MDMPVTTSPANTHDLLISILSVELRLAPEALSPDRTFTSYGADSLTAMAVAVALEDELGIAEIPPTLLWDCPTINTLVPALEALRRGAGAETAGDAA